MTAEAFPDATAASADTTDIDTLRGELAEARRQQAAMAEVLKVISNSKSDLSAVLDKLVRIAAELCNVEDVSIHRIDGDVIRYAAHFGPIPLPASEGYRLSSESPPARCMREQRRIEIADLQIENVAGSTAARTTGARTFLCVPLIVNGTAIGAFVLRRTEVRPFTERQIALVESFADQAVIVLENARLFEAERARAGELRESLEYQTATTEVLSTISQSPSDMPRIMQAIADWASRVCSPCDVSVLRPVDGVFRIIAGSCTLQQVVPPTSIASRSGIAISLGTVSGRAFLEKQTINIEDLSLELSQYPEARPHQEEVVHRSVLATPLMKDAMPLGVIYLMRDDVSPFSEVERRLIETFADQAVIAIENARLFEAEQARTRELVESLEYQTAISEVLGVISRSPSQLQPVFDAIASAAERLCGVDDAQIYRIEDGRLQHAATSSKLPPGNMRYGGVPLTRGTAIGRSIVDRQTVHIEDLQALIDTEYHDARRHQEHIGHRTTLAVPLLGREHAYGAILIRNLEVRPFTQRQIALLETFADQAVIAIQNARLFEAEQARTRELAEALECQTATAEVLNVISRSPSELQSVFDTIVRTARHLCNAEDSLISLRDGDALRLRAHDGDIPVRKEWPVDRNYVAGRCVVDGATIHIRDFSLEGAEYVHPRPNPIELGHRTMLAAPLLRQGVAIGALIVRRSLVEPFTQRQIALLETFADQAVIAIENARLLDELQTRQRELEESLERQTATSSLLEIISSSPGNLAPVFQAVVEKATTLCAAGFGNLFLYEEERLRHVAMLGVPPEFADLRRTRPIVRAGPKNALSRLIASKQLQHVADIRLDEGYLSGDQAATEIADIAGARTILMVPMLKEDTLVGVLGIFRKEVRPFSRADIELVSNFARQAVIAIENARLLDELQTRQRELQAALENQTATAEVLNVISHSPTDSKPVFDAIARSVRHLMDAQPVTVFTYDGELIHVAAFDGMDSPEGAEALMRTFPSRPGRASATARAIESLAAHYIPDVQADPEYAAAPVASVANYRSIVSVPMLRDGKPVGAITASTPVVAAFTVEKIALLKTFADQAVIAMNNARLFEEVQARTQDLARTVDELQSLSEVGRTISSSLDMQQVLATILQHACRMTETSGGTVYVYDKEGGTFRVEAAHNMLEEHLQRVRAHPMRIGDAVVGECAERRAAVQIADIAKEDPTRSPLIGILIRGGTKALLAVPLLHQSEVLGALVVRRGRPGEFPPETVRLLEMFAAQSAIAVNNARLFKEVEARTREVQESLEFQTATAEVLSVISSSPNELQPVLEAIVAIGSRLCEAEFATLFQVVDKSCIVIASNNANSDFINYLRDNPPPLTPGSPTGRAALEGRTVHIPDLLEWGDYTRGAAQRIGQQRTVLSIPLVHEGSSVGVITLMRTSVRPFTERQVQLVETFADQAVIAMNNARLFTEIRDKSRQLELASQHKSQFLANMSHELRTPLNAILGYTELMQDGIYGDLPVKAGDVLGRVQSNGRHLLGLINQVLDLSKIEAGQLQLNLAEYSLGSIVVTVIAGTESLATEKKLALKAEVAKDLPRGLGDEQRIAQVLLNLVGNAIKFTETGEVRILAAAFAGRFEIAVADTGAGIPPDEVDRIFEEFHQVDSSNTKTKGGTGLGLAIAKRIVEMHGGRICVESSVGRGSTFKIELPVRVERASQADEAGATA